jgi:hypothetical protein
VVWRQIAKATPVGVGQRRRTRPRCHRSSVAGCTNRPRQTERGSSRQSPASTAVRSRPLSTRFAYGPLEPSQPAGDTWRGLVAPPPHHPRDGRPRGHRGRAAPGHRPGQGGGRPRPTTLVTLRAGAATVRHLLADCWQTTLRRMAGDALCLVELRGFEPLTPCMPSRDPRHSAHYEALRSRPLHQSRRTGVWWFVWVRRAELLRGCCAESPEQRVGQEEL